MESPNGFMNPQQQQILQHQMQQGMRSGINASNLGLVPGTNSGYPNMINLNPQGGGVNPYGAGFSAPNNMMVSGNSLTGNFPDMQNNNNQRNPWAPASTLNSNAVKSVQGNLGGLNQNSAIPQSQNDVFINNNYDPQQAPNSSNFINPNLGQVNPTFPNSSLSSSQQQQNQQIQQQQQQQQQMFLQLYQGQTISNNPPNSSTQTSSGPQNQRSTNPNGNFSMIVGGNNLQNPSSFMGLPLSTNMKGFM